MCVIGTNMLPVSGHDSKVAVVRFAWFGNGDANFAIWGNPYEPTIFPVFFERSGLNTI